MEPTTRIVATTRPRPDPVPVATRVPFAFVHINKCAGSAIEIALGLAKRHATAEVLRAEMGTEAWARAFTFSVVRNPFERMVSVYYYRVRTDQTRLADRHLGFNAWVARVWGARDPAYTGEPLLIAPAAEWLCDTTGQVLVDRVARSETLVADWAEIARMLGVAPGLARVNENRHPPYSTLYSTEARALIEAAFRPDLEQFGYQY